MTDELRQIALDAIRYLDDAGIVGDADNLRARLVALTPVVVRWACTECGRSNSKSSAHCPQCGAPQVSGDT